MSESTTHGCGLWGFLMSMVFALLVFIAHQSISNPTNNMNMPLATLQPNTVSTEVAAMITQSIGTYFTADISTYAYTHLPDKGVPCQYYFSGKVLDLNREPFMNFVVNVRTAPLPDIAMEGPGYAFPGEGSHPEDGPSGYVLVMPNWQVPYEVWLTDKVGGHELSPHIVVPARDCDQNWTKLNFIQVKPLPPSAVK